MRPNHVINKSIRKMKTMKQQYIIVRAEKADTLAYRVNTNMALGYVPCGSLVVIADNRIPNFFQAMVLRNPAEEDGV